jgi:3-hydroxyacyl-[acyl-carrier-protein] dehydratase
MWRSLTIRFAPDHPTVAGHFPGNPIIPGAVLLDEVVAAVVGDRPGEVMIRAVKFLAPVRPGDGIELRWQGDGEGPVRFEARMLDSARLALVGSLEIGHAAP